MQTASCGFDCPLSLHTLQLGTALAGSLNSLIAFTILGPPLSPFCMWFAMASTDFWYFATYFAFPMLKVWVSSPTTLVTNYFLAGPAFVGGPQGNLGFLSILGFFPVILILFPPLFSKKRWGLSQSFHSARPAWLTVRAAWLLSNNDDAVSFAARLGSKGLVLEYNFVIEDYC